MPACLQVTTQSQCTSLHRQGTCLALRAVPVTGDLVSQSLHNVQQRVGLRELMIQLKGLAQAKSIKKSVILFWLLNITI